LNESNLFDAIYNIDADPLSKFNFTIDDQANSQYGNGFPDVDDNSDGESDGFGSNVYSHIDLDDDGNEDLIVSAFNDDYPVTNAGSIYFILMDSDDSLKDVYKLSNPNITSDDSFGHGITSFQSNNKTWLAVGSPYDDTSGENSGVIYIYDFEDFPFFPIVENRMPPVSSREGNDEEFKETQPMSETKKTTTDTDKWLTSQKNFVHGFNHLINDNKIQGNKISSSHNTPEWVMTYLGKVWYNDRISNTAYYEALQYLHDHKIIQ
jgi:hypothetical protein